VALACGVPPTDPLLPGAPRRVLALIVLGCALVVAALGTVYAGGHTPGAVDAMVDALVRRTLAGHTGVVRAVLHLADPPVVIAGQLLLVALGVLMRSPRAVVLAVAGPAVAQAATEFALKPMFGRTLHGVLVFPSGHTTSVSAVAGVLVVLLLGPARPRRAGPLVAGLLAAAAGCVAVAVALVALDYHYATDTVGGFATAVAAVLATALAVDLAPPRRWARRHRGDRSPPAGSRNHDSA
jgi:membrane-associated phospholipid phosphatase